jgi:23S rRNA (adenine2030-N6)-methyltransferase
LLSYQHDYHAGNHADVLKHWLLVECVHYLQQKPAAFEYIDTHAGSGWYRLDSPLARQTGEAAAGIGRLLQQPLPEMAGYLELVRAAVARQRYPGSCALVNELLRPQDRAWLYELHPQAFAALEQQCARPRQSFVRKADGLRALSGLLPVASRRALVLIDPSYELKSDYHDAAEAVVQAWRKMPQATFLLWYPQVDPVRVRHLERRLRQAALPELCRFELTVGRPAGGGRLRGSGVLVVNPPYTLKARVDAVLPRLAAILRQPDGASRR